MARDKNRGGRGSAAAMGSKTGTARLSVRVDQAKKSKKKQSRAERAANTGAIGGASATRTTGGVLGARRSRG